MNDQKGLYISNDIIESTTHALVERYPTAVSRIETGVGQVAAKWTEDIGTADEFKGFCVDHFTEGPADLDKMRERFARNLEHIYGHLLEIYRAVKEPIDLDLGPIAPIDEQFAKFDLFSHLTEDLFKTRIAFTILLNFKHYTLDEKATLAASWDRQQWAEARMVESVFDRVPAAVDQEIHAAFVAADSYINDYNIYMNRLVSHDGARLFPSGMKLISHWGLRDELKAQYQNPGGLAKQELIEKVMGHIIGQTLPAAVIDNPHLDWNVDDGTVTATASDDEDKKNRPDKSSKDSSGAFEADTRYCHIKSIHSAVTRADPFFPTMPTYMDRRFNSGREIPENEVVALLKSVLDSPEVKDTARFIATRLGRPLRPFDIWYNDFKPQSGLSPEDLDRIVQERYPTVAAFQEDVPHILKRIGFDNETAVFLSSKIIVDAGRGAGHALGAGRRGDNAHLRTRIPEGGMNYQSYNVAMHELGHNVEQVFSLERIDHYLLNGVPNSITEGFAFTFQALDLKVLGVEEPDPLKPHFSSLKDLWSTFEISGVALVDIGIWNWLYKNPSSTASEVKQAMIAIAKDIWNSYFAPVIGHKDATLLAVYSHIIDSGLYTPDYPLGLIIQFQLGDYFRDHGLPVEMERMCKLGELTPHEWMKQAIGSGISAEPMLAAARDALATLAQKI